MKKIITIFLTIILMGCSTQPNIQVDEPVNITFFYVETCSQCKAFKENGIPALENAFGDQLILTLYNFDDLDEEGSKRYDDIVDQLVDFDDEMYGMAPFISVDGYFVLLGYVPGDEDYLIGDIQKAMRGEKLSDELEGQRFCYEKK